MWTSVLCCSASILSRLFRSLPLQYLKERSSFWQRVWGKLSHWLATLKLHPWDQGNILGLLEGSQILQPTFQLPVPGLHFRPREIAGPTCPAISRLALDCCLTMYGLRTWSVPDITQLGQPGWMQSWFCPFKIRLRQGRGCRRRQEVVWRIC